MAPDAAASSTIVLICGAGTIDTITGSQTVSTFETIPCQRFREHEQRPMSETNKCAFDKLVAEYHYDIHEIWEIKDAIEDYFC